MIRRTIAVLVGLGVGCWAQEAKPAQTAPPAPAAKKEFVGTETCSGCHEDISTGFKKNAHAFLETNKKRGWDGKACESCHGPGSVHVETNLAGDIRSPKQMKASAIDEMCLACHKNQATHVGRLQGGHGRSGIACTSCHNMHKAGEESSSYQLKKASGINKNCASCHNDVWAAFQKPNRHRLPEGAMSCTSCHNPHASFLNKNMRLANANEPGCFSCHANKRGPFVYDHAPVRNQACSTCHEPHGSVNPRMLTRAEVAPMCLECHSNVASPSAAGTLGGIAPAIHDLRNPRYRNCTICHQKVHGSHVNRALLR